MSYHSIVFYRIIAATPNFRGMSAKNDSLLQIEEIVRIYANYKYLDRNVRWVLFILAFFFFGNFCFNPYALSTSRIDGLEFVKALPDNKFWTSKLKEFADDNFRFDENGTKLSKQVENVLSIDIEKGLELVW